MKKAATAVMVTLTKAKKDDSCPVATQNLKLNTKNRNAAIKQSHIKYGPLNVDEPGDYWKDIADFWDTTEAASKKSKCGNCVAFDISPRMDKCMPGETSDDDGRLGYCWMHHFKCHSARSCRTWAKGGPIRKDAKSLNWQKRGEGKVSKSGFVHISKRPLLGLAQILKATPPTNKPPKNGGVNPATGTTDKPPKGYQGFGSKRGGFRKPKAGGGYDYWYPGTGHSSSHHPDDKGAAGGDKGAVSGKTGAKVLDMMKKIGQKMTDPKTPGELKEKLGEMLDKLTAFAKKAGLKIQGKEEFDPDKTIKNGEMPDEIKEEVGISTEEPKEEEEKDLPGKASNTRIILASLGLTTDIPGIVTDRGLLIGAISLMGTVVFGRNKWVRDGDHWYPGNNKALKYTGTELVSLLLTKMKPEEIAKQLKNGKKKAPEKPNTEGQPQAEPSPPKEEDKRPEVDVDKKFDQMKVGLGGTFEHNDKTYTVENSFTDKRYKGGGYITFTAVDKDGNKTQGIMGIASYKKLAKPSDDDKTLVDAPAPAEVDKTLVDAPAPAEVEKTPAEKESPAVQGAKEDIKRLTEESFAKQDKEAEEYKKRVAKQRKELDQKLKNQPMKRDGGTRRKEPARPPIEVGRPKKTDQFAWR
jgi:hypothetical protein